MCPIAVEGIPCIVGSFLAVAGSMLAVAACTALDVVQPVRTAIVAAAADVVSMELQALNTADVVAITMGHDLVVLPSMALEAELVGRRTFAAVDIDVASNDVLEAVQSLKGFDGMLAALVEFDSIAGERELYIGVSIPLQTSHE